jgi:hypothetical protein
LSEDDEASAAIGRTGFAKVELIFSRFESTVRGLNGGDDEESVKLETELEAGRVFVENKPAEDVNKGEVSTLTCD